MTSLIHPKAYDCKSPEMGTRTLGSLRLEGWSEKNEKLAKRRIEC